GTAAVPLRRHVPVARQSRRRAGRLVGRSADTAPRGAAGPPGWRLALDRCDFQAPTWGRMARLGAPGAPGQPRACGESRGGDQIGGPTWEYRHDTSPDCT